MHLPTVTLLFLALTSQASADYFTHFIRYKAEPYFSRIVISWEELRGERGVDHMHANPELYATQGDYLTRGQYGGSKEITQVEKMDGHEVKTVITIQYPRGAGCGGACSDDNIQVYFDGELQLDSPIGYNHQHDLTVSKILIHVQNQTIQAISRQAVVGEHYHFIDHKESEPLRLPKE